MSSIILGYFNWILYWKDRLNKVHAKCEKFQHQVSNIILYIWSNEIFQQKQRGKNKIFAKTQVSDVYIFYLLEK